MDLEKVREFIVFSESLNFTDAAHALHMSQPSLSKHVRDLENELGVLLVERGASSGRNTLTPVGKRFIELAEPWLDDYQEIVSECRDLFSTEPPARIQDMHCSINITAQLRHLLESGGSTVGNFAYVNVDIPIRKALDQKLVDFAIYIEPSAQTHAFSGDDLKKTYGWIPLAAEPLCFLVGLGNPVATSPTISLAEIASRHIITIETSLYTNWQNATSEIFKSRGCTLAFKTVRDSPIEGGAFPIGPRNLVLCTKRFANYYQDLDVEDVRQLGIEGFEPVVYPFLIFRYDTESKVARQIIKVVSSKEG